MISTIDKEITTQLLTAPSAQFVLDWGVSNKNRTRSQFVERIQRLRNAESEKLKIATDLHYVL